MLLASALLGSVTTAVLAVRALLVMFACAHIGPALVDTPFTNSPLTTVRLVVTVLMMLVKAALVSEYPAPLIGPLHGVCEPPPLALITPPPVIEMPEPACTTPNEEAVATGSWAMGTVPLVKNEASKLIKPTPSPLYWPSTVMLLPTVTFPWAI